MTVKEYREKSPNCKYCHHCAYRAGVPLERCDATNKVMSKRTAKKCPCYVPKSWAYEIDKKGGE